MLPSSLKRRVTPSTDPSFRAEKSVLNFRKGRFCDFYIRDSCDVDRRAALYFFVDCRRCVVPKLVRTERLHIALL